MVLAGAQIQGNIFGAFSAQVEALDSGGLVLATFATAGNSTNSADNSAVFIGVQATGGSTFQALRFSVTRGDGIPESFSINQFSFTLSDGPPVTATPLPPTIVAALLGVAGLGSVSLRRRSKLAPGV